MVTAAVEAAMSSYPLDNGPAYRVDDIPVPDEPSPRTSAKWKPSRPLALKYMDDGMTLEQLNFETVAPVDGVKRKHAVQSQNVFKAVINKARSRGIRVNTATTSLVLVSDSLKCTAEAYIEGDAGGHIGSTKSMKVLGFHMSDKPTAASHVEALRKRFRQQYWVLFHLKKFGFSQQELCKVYRTIIRPVADYCSVVYHAMLTDEQDEVLDRCQAHALRCIFGKDMSYEKMRDLAGVTTLRQRRVELCDRFAAKCLKNPRFVSWFPQRTGRRGGRNSEQYLEAFARCDRLKNSPIYYMRRRLNGKQGKTYGARYAERRAQ